jgi:hypothetical protein
VNAATQVEHAKPPMTRNKLTERKIDCLPLRPRADQTLSLEQHRVIDLDVRPHTPQHTHDSV